MDLMLALRADYFDQVRRGVKVEEMRVVNPHWARRLEGQNYDRIIITHGKVDMDEPAKRIERPWQGFRRCWVRPLLPGADIVEVFAIAVHDPNGNWQPIESAPRDGSRVLLRFESGFDKVASWLWHPVGNVTQGVFERGTWVAENGLAFKQTPVLWRIFPLEAQTLLVNHHV